MAQFHSVWQTPSWRRSSLARLTFALLACIAAVNGLPGAELLPAPFSSLATRAGQAQVSSVNDVKSLLSQTLPANAMELGQAFAAAHRGDTITIRGYIPAAREAFDSRAAVFTLAASASATKQGDALAHSAQIRVLNNKQETLAGSLSGRHGLKPGAEVFATGKIESIADGVLTLTLVSMHIPRDPLPESLFSKHPAPQAMDVSKARRERIFKRGEEVVLVGRVGGSKHPFVAGRLVFTLIGRGLKACNEIPGDSCPEPWDYCCDSRDEILANSVTVQVVNHTGQILRTDLKGRRGVTELTEIIVSGTVSVADGKAVIVNATHLWLADEHRTTLQGDAAPSP
ncbi:MAG: hypothetical protein KF864_08455 [Phycisphaeraceae bacterium]|nr:hypothetical protein [Phycisphaeraceae bacterium]